MERRPRFVPLQTEFDKLCLHLLNVEVLGTELMHAAQWWHPAEVL